MVDFLVNLYIQLVAKFTGPASRLRDHKLNNLVVKSLLVASAITYLTFVALVFALIPWKIMHQNGHLWVETLLINGILLINNLWLGKQVFRGFAKAWHTDGNKTNNQLMFERVIHGTYLIFLSVTSPIFWFCLYVVIFGDWLMFVLFVSPESTYVCYLLALVLLDAPYRPNKSKQTSLMLAKNVALSGA